MAFVKHSLRYQSGSLAVIPRFLCKHFEPDNCRNSCGKYIYVILATVCMYSYVCWGV